MNKKTMVGFGYSLLAFFVLFAAATAPAMARKPEHPLSKLHKKWLEEDVGYIISKVERQVFLEQKTDQDRDRFIDAFWESRDPSPGTPENEFKTEHYRRLSYVNSKYIMEGAPGWRTDRGRIYIQLGQPAQILDWTADYHIYPVELWFYTNRQHPSLQSAFYVMFFDPENAGYYKLYSPYNHGPERLTHGTNISTRKQAYEYMYGVNAELARAALTLIPSEPVDMEYMRPSMESDINLNNIRELPNEEAKTGYLRMFISDPSRLKEKIDTRIVYNTGAATLNVATTPAVDKDGNPILHWACKIYPKELSLARYNERYYFSLEITANVTDEAGKVLLRHTQEVLKYFTDEEFARIKSMSLQFQDKLGLVPGNYKLDVLVYNRITSQTLTQTRPFSIPALPVPRPTVGALTLADSFGPLGENSNENQSLSFCFSGSYFSPSCDRKTGLAERIGVLYPLYWPVEQIKDQPDTQVSLEYRVLSENTEMPSKTLIDTVRLGQFNASGTMLNFKQIPLVGLQTGRHTLVVAVKNAEGTVIASSSVLFTLEASRKAPMQTVFAAGLAVDEAGQYDYQRSQLLGAAGYPEDAQKYLERAVLKAPTRTAPSLALATRRYDSGKAQEAVDLLKRVKDNSDFPVEGKLLLAKALTAVDDKVGAEAVLDAFVQSGKATLAEYAESVTLYEKLGNAVKAAQVRKELDAKGEKKK